ncbi:hypothetical protein LCGC14_1666410 [marine sediment metagenome]|uniref:Portal protein n=1 Tax=marine sediment metagenome TaxID=412755 RepID=A0A0F9KSH1_9ZZZZ
MSSFSLSESSFEQLTQSIEWSNRQLRYNRKRRVQAVKEYVGFNYAQNGAVKRVPTPFLKLAVSIYVRQLSPGVPRAMFTTPIPSFKATSADFELAVNLIPDEIGLQNTFRKIVTESLFFMGIAKCGLHAAGKMLDHSIGESFVDSITADDLVLDMSAKDMDVIQYVGNDYWMDLDEVKGNDYYRFGKNVKLLEADPYNMQLQTEEGEDRAETVTVNESVELYRPKVFLRDVWLPDEEVVVTYAVSGKKILNIVEWEGPRIGPYIFLGYDFVPGNLLPFPPVAAWLDLHVLANSLFRKLGDQADAQKTIPAFSGGDDEGAKAFKNARDGEGINYTGVPPINLKTGGVDATTLGFYNQCRELFSYFGGNLDSMGGLGAQTETVGQDRLIAAASSAQVKGMVDKVSQFSKEIFSSLAFYEWNDPMSSRMLEKKIPGTDLSMNVPWSETTKSGEFNDFVLSIDVYSLQDQSPLMKLEKLKMFIAEFVLPFMPAIEQSGGVLGVQEVLQLAARFSGLPEAADIVHWTQTDTSKTGFNQAGKAAGATGGGGNAPQPMPSNESAFSTEVPAARPGGENLVQ